MSNSSRRRFLAAASSLACTAGLSQFAPAQEGNEAADLSKEAMTPETQRAVDKGLAWLAKRQVTRGNNTGAFGHGGYAGGVAVCGLSGLAFMCGGSPPGQGPYGRNVDKCVEYVVSCVGETGYIAVPGVGMDNMYGHGFAMLFLSEAYGMSTRPDADSLIGEKLRKAVELTIKCQNDAGGWRYQPVKSDADLSITICQIMGLRAARDAGIHVPDETRNKCIEYVKKSQNPDGGFRYTISGGGSSFPLTGAGVVSLYSAGIYDGEPIEKGLKYLMNYLPGKGSSNTSYFFYGHYYAVQAMWHAGGKYWQTWYPAIRDTLLARQQSDGSWPESEVQSPEFGTAMACIILQMPNNFLPIFSP